MNSLDIFLSKEVLDKIPYETWLQYHKIIDEMVDDAERAMGEVMLEILEKTQTQRLPNGLLPEAVRLDKTYQVAKKAFDEKFALQRKFSQHSPKKYQEKRFTEYRERQIEHAKQKKRDRS